MTGPLLLTLLVLLAGATPAGAAEVRFVPPPPDDAPSPEQSCSRYGQCPPPRLEVEAAPGERNDLSFDAAPPPGRVVLRDAGAPLRTSAPCELLSDGAVSCPAGGVAEIRAGDGDDRVAAPQATVEGGAGNDVITGANADGGAGDDVLTGTDGPNALTGGAGDDVVRGLAAGDTIVDEAVPEADRLLDGGDADDVISFRGRAVAVRVDLDPGALHAASEGEGNVVVSMEGVVGGSGDDALSGAPTTPNAPIFPASIAGGDGDDQIVLQAAGGGSASGDEGDDVITGGRGRDTLNGGPGDDRIGGGAGRDALEGVDGEDRLDGGAGNDALDGGPGADVLRGGAGNDSVLAFRGGRDRIACGSGRRDRADVDRRDRVGGCERVRRRP
jgi:Ca2+-binding RTX toxin-like protein